MMAAATGALSRRSAARAELASAALEHFEARFRDDPLVMDKWFSLQALAPEPIDGTPAQALTQVRTLMKRPDFSLKNPNRARSLIFALCSGNPAGFHRSDAAGYVFWADRLLELDGLNPQLAARLARVMDRWRVLAEPYRSAAREAIARVAAKPDLSNDVREIVMHALDAE
jgi:aminopeptidase N